MARFNVKTDDDARQLIDMAIQDKSKSIKISDREVFLVLSVSIKTIIELRAEVASLELKVASLEEEAYSTAISDKLHGE